MAATRDRSASMSQCAMKKSGLALRKTTAVSSVACSMRVTSSASCSTVSGSIRLISPLEKVTRQ